MYKAVSSEDVFVRILVDGLNTVSQRQMTVSGGTRGAYIEAAQNPEGDYVVAPRVSLEEARAWVVTKGTRNPVQALGFYDANLTSDTVRRFRIVDADESAAARKNYTEQIGLITVAFYKGVSPSSAPRGIGTGMHKVENTRIERYEGDKVPGDLIAVYNIRYMTPEMLKQTVK